MKKVTAIYVRRSVSDKDKDNNSFSIDSQKADCIRFLKEGEKYEIYCDDGKSGKNIEGRPDFLHMMEDVESGLIERIVVKKLDRFSRSLRDFYNVMDVLDRYGVSLCSTTESFDTATELGRLMLSILLSFAQFERETISSRVTDAYIIRAEQTGFYQGGKVYYGYTPERRMVGETKGSVLVPSDKAEVIVKAYDIYKNPSTSLADIISYFREKGIDINVPRKVKDKDGNKEVKMSNMDRSHFSRLLESPLYVKADIEVYQYLFSQGYEMLDDVEAFDGVHGLFRHKRANSKEYIKVGYHEGLVDSETWLAVQDKKSHNQKIPNNATAKNSWLVGLTKCRHCGYSFLIQYSWNVSKTVQWRYYLDSGAYRADGCVSKRLKTRPDHVEQEVFNAMKQRLENLEVVKTEQAKPDKETENMKAEIIRIEERIRNLMDDYEKTTGAMRKQINDRVNKLDAEMAELDEKIRARARKQKVIDTAPLIEPMSRFDSLTTDEKHALAVAMIDVIYVSDETGIDIIFNI